MIKIFGKLAGEHQNRLLDDLQQGGAVYFEYEHLPFYAADKTPILLAVLFLREGVDANPRDTCLISDQPAKMRALVSAQASSHADTSYPGLFAEVARLSGLTPLELTRPLRLTPTFIPKPWGQERWYTGIEARGMSRMEDTPIAWVLDIFGRRLTGHAADTGAAPILLKILDPHPEENLGDLYFEMHQEKVEVYVVTHLDAAAWGTGPGQIRYGFNQDALREAPSREEFLQLYLSAVEAYREVRAQLDALLDERKHHAGMDPNQAMSPATHAQWNKDLPQDLLAEEVRRRDAMYAYTSVQDLAVGDVIQVQPGMPHSLQHGVRVVEFQTPHYERFILSFGQKVLTQPGWDTQEALLLANTQGAPPASIKAVAPGIDQIADFSRFQVLRIMLAAGDSKILPWEGRFEKRFKKNSEQGTEQNFVTSYALAIGILGELSISQVEAGRRRQKKTAPHRLYTKVLPEEAFYIPAAGKQLLLTNTGSGQASILIAFPSKKSSKKSSEEASLPSGSKPGGNPEWRRKPPA